MTKRENTPSKRDVHKVDVSTKMSNMLQETYKRKSPETKRRLQSLLQFQPSGKPDTKYHMASSLIKTYNRKSYQSREALREVMRFSNEQKGQRI